MHKSAINTTASNFIFVLWFERTILQFNSFKSDKTLLSPSKRLAHVTSYDVNRDVKMRLWRHKVTQRERNYAWYVISLRHNLAGDRIAFCGKISPRNKIASPRYPCSIGKSRTGNGIVFGRWFWFWSRSKRPFSLFTWWKGLLNAQTWSTSGFCQILIEIESRSRYTQKDSRF